MGFRRGDGGASRASQESKSTGSGKNDDFLREQHLVRDLKSLDCSNVVGKTLLYIVFVRSTARGVVCL